MSTQPRTSIRAMTPTNVPERSGSTVSEDSSGSSGTKKQPASWPRDATVMLMAPLAEDRVRKFQKTGEQGNRLRKTSVSNAITAGRPLPPINHNAAGRGRAKVPLGPREPRQDFSKQSSREREPSCRVLESTKEEELSESFGSYDFLPSVNFDDFANSLAYEPALSDFPVPGTFTSNVAAGNGQVQMQPFTSNPVDPYPTRTSSFARRFSQSTARKVSGGSTASGSDTSSMLPPPSNMAIRTRRQSQFPAQAPPNPAARPPRKSVGPGMLPTNSFERDMANDNTMPRLTRAPSFTKGGRRETLSANLSSTTTGLPTATRNAKAKSLQPPSRHQSGHLTVSSNAPDLNPMPNNARSPGRSPGAQPSYTPSSANKRQSAAPHISGLGARTISPTDARRLRRLSINPNHPPSGGPVGPPTPQADAAFDERAFSQSPAMVHGGNMTPSSARATPEQKRKSYASGVSLSSNSSLNSLKVGPSSIPLRVNPAPSGSRLPAPKPRNVQSSAGGEQEEVPPVPAIPKAYESPKEPERGSFTFTTAPSKMSTPQPAPQESMATPEAQKPDPRQNETSDGSFSNRSSGSIRHRRGLTVGNGPEQERTPTVQQSSKKNLQPIRLPPLNLLPLGTPFNNRMSSFPTPSGELEEGAVTPPPKRALNKTPSTPMTASKANFFSRHTSHDEYHKHLRSSSSAFNLRQTDSSLDAHPNIGNLPIPTLNPTRQATTPFSSNSLPKGSGEFARLQSRPSGEYKSSLKDVEMQSMVAGPRPLQKTLTSDSAQTSTSTEQEPETPSSGSSLRRKLSLSGWRRASSKAASHPAQTAQRMLGTKSSSNMLKSRNLDPNLDRDDMLADEEMKKLASKRKDFEHAARDVDELRKRATAKERVSPSDAMRMANLNIFERGEIIDYKEVYFCGTKNAKKHVGDLNAQTANFGYDDERGDYNIVLGDHLAYRYEVVDVLGKGSFGQVVRCIDHKTGGLEAIKIIRNKKRFHQQALVEVNILQKLREWDPDNKHSMINFTQSFYFRGHLCISTELLGMNLYEFIKAHEFKGFSVRLIRRFCKQMLASLVLLKAQKVIHCDLKPENILLAHPLHSEIKVIDFGSSCFETEKVYTYIQSRFYRSPEVILGMSYGLPIDMWSLGCILAELLTGYPIFPGENEQEQLACIMEIFGPPEKHLIEKSSRKKLFFDSLGKPRVTVSSKGRRRRPSSKTLQQALKCDDEAFLDFVARCLRWDPERRMKPDEAMQHEFITGVRKTSQPRRTFNGSTGVSSPAKRVPAAPTSQPRVRPLPEPPATSFRNATAASGQREVATSNSPSKGSAPQRRHSNVQGNLVGTKRAANGAPLNTAGGSGLPRVAQRSVSGKPDLASAAAIASLKSRS
ncbi:SPS1, serine threonine protein kinase [Pyrenophora tritici-repentis]|nr:SPS1, serine threonine protein kinase [Pyrenophora tritici-repentis]